MQRRQILQSTLALAGASLSARAFRARAPSQSGSDAIEVPVELPKGFRWGAPSSSYQSESLMDNFEWTAGLFTALRFGLRRLRRQLQAHHQGVGPLVCKDGGGEQAGLIPAVI
jgi:hypothetical protein